MADGSKRDTCRGMRFRPKIVTSARSPDRYLSVPSADSAVGGAGWSWTTCSHQESSGLGSGHTIASSATGAALSPGWLAAVPMESFQLSVSDMIVRILSRQLACAWRRWGKLGDQLFPFVESDGVGRRRRGVGPAVRSTRLRAAPITVR